MSSIITKATLISNINGEQMSVFKLESYWAYLIGTGMLILIPSEADAHIHNTHTSTHLHTHTSIHTAHIYTKDNTHTN